MPKFDQFILKDSPPEVKALTTAEPKGRAYSEKLSYQPGGIKIDEVALAMQLAALSVTDDKAGTLAKVGEANPWHVEALKFLTGSEEEAHKPLSEILYEHYGLQVDEHIDISGYEGGYAIDTQGYIAHNDDVIVVSFRCTTSIKDWITNITLTDVEWKPEEEGPSTNDCGTDCGSGLFGWLFGDSDAKPRVHAGFYNNFLAVLPTLKKHVNPLLDKNAPPRKLYIVGHSLGAGIAAMAGCYYLLHHDWTSSPHRFVNAMAGSPRACGETMAQLVEERLKSLQPLDKVSMFRITLNEDVVPTVPPAWLGFSHIGKLVYITEDGAVLIGPKLDDERILDEDEVKQIGDTYPDAVTIREKKTLSEYEQFVYLIPQGFRDHMPDFYLKPLVALFERVHGTISPTKTEPVPVKYTKEVDDDQLSGINISISRSNSRSFKIPTLKSLGSMKKGSKKTGTEKMGKVEPEKSSYEKTVSEKIGCKKTKSLKIASCMPRKGRCVPQNNY